MVWERVSPFPFNVVCVVAWSTTCGGCTMRVDEHPPPVWGDTPSGEPFWNIILRLESY